MYYVLARNGRLPGRWVDIFPYMKGVRWTRGSRFTTSPPTPIEVTLQPFDPNSADDAPYVPEYLQEDAPLFRTDLIEAMREAGVDNLDVYDAVLIDPDNGARLHTHKAVNIIGAISAADMAKSDAVVHSGGPIIDVDFDSLAVDEKRARGALLFRLAESTNAILVHERLRDHLLAKGFTHLAFYDPAKVAL